MEDFLADFFHGVKGLIAAGEIAEARELLAAHTTGEEAWRAYELLGACAFALGDAPAAAQAYFAAARHDKYLRSQRSHYSSYLFCLHYLSGISDEELAEQHFVYNSLFRDAETFSPRETKGRGKIKVGYLAPDFGEQAAARFFEPLLTEYDAENFAVCVYELHPRDDDLSRRLKNSVGEWRDLRKLSLADAAAAIYDDAPDILFDLGGHTAGGETLMIMAYRPAPIQLTGLGWFDTTGLQAVDYILGDNVTAPRERERFFSEKVWRLPRQLCYRPRPGMDAYEPVFGGGERLLTFGCFNNFMKITDELLDDWREILRAVPSSRLLLQDTTPLESRQRELVRRLRAAGFPDGAFCVRCGHDDYLRDYAEVDVMLDTYPYPGGVTTCEALFMGVPVVTRRGSRYGACFGASLMDAAGLSELIATGEGDYIAKAVALAQDADRRQKLREGLRRTMMASPLTDSRDYMAHIEDMYRRMVGR